MKRMARISRMSLWMISRVISTASHPSGVTPRRDAFFLTSVRWSQTDRFAKAVAN
jgi:hypothetical protein